MQFKVRQPDNPIKAIYSTRMTKSLLLDASYRPIDIISWERAICLMVTDRAEVLQESDIVVRSIDKEFRIPKVIKLTKIHKGKNQPSFSKNSVFLRDNCTCAYCGTKVSKQKVTIDHIKPKSQGGKNAWENVISSCLSCNNKKGGRTPEQAGMKLLFKPRVPNRAELLLNAVKDTEIYKSIVAEFPFLSIS